MATTPAPTSSMWSPFMTGVSPPTGAPNQPQQQPGLWTGFQPQQTQSSAPLPGLPTGQSVPNADLGKTEQSLQGQVNQNLGSPMDWSGFMQGGDRVNGGNYYDQTAIDANKGYFDLWNNDQFNTDTAQLETTLRNRGVKPGDAGYDQQLQLLRDEQGKLRESSNLQAIQAGQQQASNLQGMDINAGNYNTAQRNNQVSEAITRRDMPLQELTALNAERQPDKNVNDAKQASYLEAVPGVLDLLKTGADGSSLLGAGIDATSGVINKLTGGATTGLGTKLAGAAGNALGLGGAGLASAGAINAGLAGTTMAGLGGELAAATNAAAPALSAAMAGTTGAGAAGTTAAGAAAGSGAGIGSTLLAAAPYVAAAIAAAAVISNNVKKSSPLNDFDLNTGGWTKPQNFDGQKFSPEDLNAYFGPAIQVFSQTGDAQKALAAIPQPQNATQQAMLKGGAKALFDGTGNPFRQIAKAKGFGEGIWTAGNENKKAMIKQLSGK